MKKMIAAWLLTSSVILSSYAAGSAHFSSFVYEGQDDYYSNRPLQDGEFYNPILAGWTSDPSICHVGEDYYLVTSSFGYFPGVPLFHSKDLVNWEQIGNVLDRPSQLPYLAGQSVDKGGIYAPHISYNPNNGLYYVITTDVGKGHFYVTSSDPNESWSDPVWLPAIDGIDPSFFFDDNGEAYIVYKEDTEGRPKWSNYRCIRFIRFDAESGNTVGDSMPLREKGVGPDERLDRNEGPHIYKINGQYYLVCAEGGTGDQHSAVVYKSDSVLGEYTRWSRNPMITQRGQKSNRANPVTCTGHADLVQDNGGRWWAVFLACRPGVGNFQLMGRETFMLPVNWSADGFPYLLQSVDTVPLVSKMGEMRRVDSPVSGNFRWEDDFNSPSLKPEWMSPHGSAHQMYFTGDGLTLTCSPVAITQDNTPAYIGRRVSHHKFQTQTSVRLDGATSSESAGLLLYKNDNRHYSFVITPRTIEVRQGGKNGKYEVVASKDIAVDGSTDMRITSDGYSLTFEYKPQNEAEWIKLCDNVDLSYVSCERTGGFTGATIGVFAMNESSDER